MTVVLQELRVDRRDSSFPTAWRGSPSVIADQLQKLGRAQPGADASSMMAELLGALSLARAEADPQRSATILEVSWQSLIARLGLDED